MHLYIQCSYLLAIIRYIYSLICGNSWYGYSHGIGFVPVLSCKECKVFCGILLFDNFFVDLIVIHENHKIKYTLKLFMYPVVIADQVNHIGYSKY